MAARRLPDTGLGLVMKAAERLHCLCGSSALELVFTYRAAENRHDIGAGTEQREEGSRAVVSSAPGPFWQ